ncbi:MAG: rane protein [Bryobacterales bacterium]|nr:rane protein [Bryobacterales bacterium]
MAWGPAGLFLLAAADSVGIPAVGGVDALLITIATTRPALGYISAVCAIAGSILGSIVLFAIARKGGQVFLARYTSKGTGRRLHAWFERYGLATVFVPAVSPLPMPMKIPVFCSGAMGVHWAAFIGTVIAARTIRYFALAYLAERYGTGTLTFLKYHWGAVLAFAISLAAAAVIVLRLLQKRQQLVS